MKCTVSVTCGPPYEPMKAGDLGTASWLIQQLQKLDPATPVWIEVPDYDDTTYLACVAYLEPHTTYHDNEKGVVLYDSQRIN